jgi:putative SOS response-associated peptidase YedK
MTISDLAHADSLERLALTGEFDAWLDATAPTPEEQEQILHHMHEEDLARQAERFSSLADQLAH